MMLYEGDVRRCRRCKRRRMDDEPPEVQQYKTCAKCRIIERTKKKSRKPLAEETMRYGMRQFQEQNQNSNFIHDDIFSNDQLINDMQNARDSGAVNPSKQSYNTQFAMYKQPANAQFPAGGVAGPNAANYNYTYGNGQGAYPGAMGPGGSAGSSAYGTPSMGQQQMPQNAGMFPPTTAATAAAIAAAAIKRSDMSLGSSSLNRSQNHYRQYQQKQEGDRSRLTVPTNCELCSTKLDADDPISAMYRLSRKCYSDPYSRPNVFADFNDFLLEVVKNKDMDSVIYISELASYLVESLNNERIVNSEEQFRKYMLESFNSIYMDPLMASLAPLKFSKVSSNVAEVNNTSPVLSKVSSQLHYTLTPPLRTSYVANSSAGATTLELAFITETNLIIVKKLTKRATPDYSTAFLKSLDEQMRAKGFTFDDEPAKIFSELDLSIDSEQFQKDFKSLQEQITTTRATEAEKAQNAEEDMSFKAGDNDKDTPKPAAVNQENGKSDTEDTDAANGAGENADNSFDEDEDDEEEDDDEDPDDLDPAFAP